MLALVDLASYGDRSIFELSGGERQRVALARSLAPHPRLLMLDEPLGSLDRTLRDELVTELRTILKQVDATALYVTHDQQEAFAVADRLVVMRAGRIEQIGTPQAIYQTPANTFVARFLGLSNLVPVAVNKAVSGQLQTPFGNWSLVADGENRLNHAAFDATAKLCLLIRPDAVTALDLADNTVAPTPARPTISGLLQIPRFAAPPTVWKS
ncbi:MAG: ABC transporter ATP-binding protein [Caldilineaceae bacterium]